MEEDAPGAGKPAHHRPYRHLQDLRRFFIRKSFHANESDQHLLIDGNCAMPWLTSASVSRLSVTVRPSSPGRS